MKNKNFLALPLILCSCVTTGMNEEALPTSSSSYARSSSYTHQQNVYMRNQQEVGYLRNRIRFLEGEMQRSRQRQAMEVYRQQEQALRNYRAQLQAMEARVAADNARAQQIAVRQQQDAYAQMQDLDNRNRVLQEQRDFERARANSLVTAQEEEAKRQREREERQRNNRPMAAPVIVPPAAPVMPLGSAMSPLPPAPVAPPVNLREPALASNQAPSVSVSHAVPANPGAVSSNFVSGPAAPFSAPNTPEKREEAHQNVSISPPGGISFEEDVKSSSGASLSKAQSPVILPKKTVEEEKKRVGNSVGNNLNTMSAKESADLERAMKESLKTFEKEELQRNERQLQNKNKPVSQSSMTPPGGLSFGKSSVSSRNMYSQKDSIQDQSFRGADTSRAEDFSFAPSEAMASR